MCSMPEFSFALALPGTSGQVIDVPKPKLSPHDGVVNVRY